MYDVVNFNLLKEIMIYVLILITLIVLFFLIYYLFRQEVDTLSAITIASILTLAGLLFQLILSFYTKSRSSPAGLDCYDKMAYYIILAAGILTIIYVIIYAYIKAFEKVGIYK